MHRYFLGLERDKEISWKRAVESWYDQVYMPLVSVIREAGILRHFPSRTEADLYLWVIEHLWYLREECPECDTSLEQATIDFTRRFSSNPPLRQSVLDKLRQTLASRLNKKKE